MREYYTREMLAQTGAAALTEYAATAKSDEAFAAFRARYLDVSEADYQRAVRERRAAAGARP